MCPNSCGFFGSAATKNLCSKCYREHLINAADAVAEKKKVEVAKAAAAAAPHTPEQSTGHDPDAAAAPAVVATATAPVAQATAEKDKETGLETQKQEEASGGSASTIECANRCSGCYRDRDFPENVDAAGPAVADEVVVLAAAGQLAAAQISAATSSAAAAVVEAPPAAMNSSNRCASCCKKVGLLGFPCRCGGTFCSLHRYAEKHACDFDFKTAGREKIAKNNPLVLAAKIDKI